MILGRARDAIVTATVLGMVPVGSHPTRCINDPMRAVETNDTLLGALTAESRYQMNRMHLGSTHNTKQQ